MSDYSTAWYLITSAADGKPVSEVTKTFTVDQKLKAAEVVALLSIAQELSRIHHDGINPKYRA